MNGDNNSRDDSPAVIACPTCRKESSVPPNGVVGFQTNFYIENLDQANPDVCDLCSPESREAIAYCTDCEKSICLQCFLQHASYTKEHLVRLVSSKAKPEKASLNDGKVQEQLRVVEAMLGLLQKEQSELSSQAQMAKGVIKARYSMNLMQLAAQAQEDCLGRLREALEVQESRLRGEREELQAKQTALKQLLSRKRDSQSPRPSTCPELQADLANDENVRGLQQRVDSARHGSLITLTNDSSSLRLLEFIGLVRPTRPGCQTPVQRTVLDEWVRKTIDSDRQQENTNSASQQVSSSDDVDNHQSWTLLATRVDDLAAQVADLKTENSALKNELSTFRDTSIQLHTELRTLENSYSRLLQEVKSAKEKNALLSQDVTSMGEANTRLRKDLSAVEKETSRLCQDLKSQQEDCEKRQEGVTSLQRDRSELFQHLEKVGNENSRLGQDLADVKKENSKLRQDIEQADDNHCKLQQDFQLCRTLTEACQQDTSVCQTQTFDLQRDLQTCVSQVAGLQQGLSSLQGFLKRAGCKTEDFISWVKESIPALQKSISCLQKEDREHSAKIRSLYKLMKQAKEAVAFHAVLDSERVLVAQQPLIVDHVLTNIGGGYDRRTGVFTAPVSGVYLFLVTTGSLRGRIRVDVVLNDRRLAHSFALADSRTTCHAIAHVRAGGKVWLRSLDDEGSTMFDSGWVTTFTGCLLTGEPFRDKLTL